MGKFADRLMGRQIEERADSYTDTLVSLLVSGAEGKIAKATATAALEACAGLVGRAFASATVQGPDLVVDAFGPRLRSMVGRSLVRSGEAVLSIDVGTGSLALRPASDWDIEGSYDPRTWLYRLSLAGPSLQATRSAQAGDDVLHFVWETDPGRPWRGVGPIESATMAGRLSAELVNALADEASGTRGHVLPIPVDGEDPTVVKLKADLKVLRGQTAVVESSESGSWKNEDPNSTSRNRDWAPRRLGASPPDPVVRLYESATREILAAVGLSPLIFGLGMGDSSAVREAWRLALHSVFEPVGEMVAEELSSKLGVDVSLDWTALRASDLQGRARSFQSMIPSSEGAPGLEVEEAKRIAGLGG